MLWELFIATGAMVFVISAIDSARHVNTGPGGYVLVAAVGLIFAFFYELVAHEFADVFDDRKHHLSEAAQKWCLRSLYVGPMLFLPFAALIGEYVSLSLLRLR